MKGTVNLIFLILMSVPAGFARAQTPQSLTAAKAVSLYGLGESEISNRFGKPDEIKTKSAESAEWLYGQSTVFFLQGKVSAWSDAGELSQREKLTALQTDKSPKDDSLSDQWVNPWTPPNKSAAKADKLKGVIDE